MIWSWLKIEMIFVSLRSFKLVPPVTVGLTLALSLWVDDTRKKWSWCHLCFAISQNLQEYIHTYVYSKNITIHMNVTYRIYSSNIHRLSLLNQKIWHKFNVPMTFTVALLMILPAILVALQKYVPLSCHVTFLMMNSFRLSGFTWNRLSWAAGKFLPPSLLQDK